MRRVPEFDGLRGLAVLAVMGFHFRPDRLTYGWMAVDLFFVLSGYLITTILLDNRGVPGALWTFYARRSLRIWPIYYLMIAAVVVAGRFHLIRYSPGGLGYYFTYMQHVPQYWSSKFDGEIPMLSHTWTLAMEEQFYIFWPIVVTLAGRRWLVPIALAYMGLSAVLRGAGFFGCLLLTRGDGFALGGILAVVVPMLKRGGPVAARGKVALGSLGAVGLVGLGMVRGLDLPLPRSVNGSIGIAAECLFFFSLVGLVACSSGSRSVGWLRDRRLCGIGLVSYGLYLYHIPVMYAIGLVLRKLGVSDRIGPGQPWWCVAIDAAASLGLAVLSWVVVERPILALKDRFRYKTGPRPSPAPEPRGLPGGDPPLDLPLLAR